MAQATPPVGGTCYYGLTTDSMSDFTTGMSYLTGTANNISSVYDGVTYTLKYTWMDSEHHIIKTPVRSSSPWAFSIYVSPKGDVFAIIDTNASSYTGSAPAYSSSGGASPWYGGNATGKTDASTQIIIWKMAATDVAGHGDVSYIYGIPESGNTQIYLYPDNRTQSAAYMSTVQGVQCSASSFVVLGPIYGDGSNGVSTYARCIHGHTAEGLATGSYTIGGYKFQITGAHLNYYDRYIALAADNS